MASIKTFSTLLCSQFAVHEIKRVSCLKRQIHAFFFSYG